MINPETPGGEPTGEFNSSEYTDEQIDQIAGSVDLISLATPYIENLAWVVLGREGHEEPRVRREPELPPEIDGELKEIIAGKTLVDLGCGDMTRPRYINEESKGPVAVQLAKHWGADVYTAVDPYHIPEIKDNEGRERMKRYEERVSEIFGLRIKYARSDMLHFVHSQLDNQNCYLVSGIDNEIIEGAGEGPTEHLTKYTEYQKATIKELYRTTSRRGVVISNRSPFFDREYMEEAGFRPIELRNWDITFWIKD